MSANNWAVCPQCLDKAKAATTARQVKADESYGKVPATEYQQLVIAAAEKIDMTKIQTFREDYEFYLEGYVLHIVYGGSCKTCKFSFTIDESRSIKP